MNSWFYIIITSICLSFIGIFVKLIGSDIAPMTLNFLRIFIGLIFLSVVIPFMDKKVFIQPRRDLWEYFILGILLAIMLSSFNFANLNAPIQNVILISFSAPIFVLFFARIIVKEKITKEKIFSLIIAGIGMFIINPFSSGQYFVGHSYALLNAVSAGLFITLMRKASLKHTIGDLFWIFLFASLVLLPFAINSGFSGMSNNFWNLLFLGIISTGIAYLFQNLALMHMEAELVSMIQLIIVPIISILLAIIILDESINFRIIIGGAILIFSGIYLNFHKLTDKLNVFGIKRKPLKPSA